jgi:glycosyltransferase involved in cell wall biosynthesis
MLFAVDGVIQLMNLCDKTYVLAAHVVEGFTSEFEYITSFLRENGAKRIVTIGHPLSKQSSGKSHVYSYRGSSSRGFSFSRPNIIPYTYPLDFTSGLLPLKADYWIGFNPLMTAAGCLLRHKTVKVNWGIDFVPVRNEGALSEKIYRGIERFTMKNIDVQVENSRAALDERSARHGVVPSRQLLAPIGISVEDLNPPHISRLKNPRIVYLGGLNPRNGSDFLVQIIRKLSVVDSTIGIDVIGVGPQSDVVRQEIENCGNPTLYKFHGYIKDQEDINTILRQSFLALAPFSMNDNSFTQYADPQKLKYYASNSLPMLISDVPPNAKTIANLGAAKLMDSRLIIDDWIHAIKEIAKNEAEWMRMASSSYGYAQEFLRPAIYERIFTELEVVREHKLLLAKSQTLLRKTKQ